MSGSNEPMAHLFPDLPVRDDERLHFQFEGFAKTLAELALNRTNRTPFTAVVRGGWGRGKTTLLRRVEHLLGEEPESVAAGRPCRNVKTLWFNAWKYPTEDTVLAGLLGALIDSLRSGTRAEQFVALVDGYKGSALAGLLRYAAPLATGLPAGLVGADGSGLESRYATAAAKRAFHDAFRQLFGQLSYLSFHPGAAVRHLDGRKIEDLWKKHEDQQTLAVFLDDLDRCKQERVIEVVEAINLFLDLPGVCFYLGVDWERLTLALPEAMRDNADDFLEKIVQVSFELPAITEPAARDYIADLVEETPLLDILPSTADGDRDGDSDGDGDGEDAVSAVTRALNNRHPRHIKRFLNDLSMGLGVLRNTEKLGDGEHQVPGAAVLAWHLLAEVLPTQEWRDLCAQPANVRTLLRRWSELEEGSQEVRDSLLSVHRSKLRPSDVAALAALEADQLHELMYLASPPRTSEPSTRQRRGRLDLSDLDGPAWVRLDAGTFTMGSDDGGDNEAPPHPVQLRSFLIAKHPVTNAQYAEFVTADAEATVPRHWDGAQIPEGKGDHPVVNVSWNDAVRFCDWLTKRTKVDGGTAHLPTEAQWEYAARGAEGRVYPWGSADPTPERSNYDESKIQDTTPVGAYPKGATPEGVNDLAGNVWEWCFDRYRSYPEEDGKDVQDPPGPGTGSSRVVRGGSFLSEAGNLRAAYRINYHPGNRSGRMGFRVAWSASGGLK